MESAKSAVSADVESKVAAAKTEAVSTAKSETLAEVEPKITAR